MTKSQSVLYTNVYSVLMQRSSAMYSFQVSVFTRVHLIGNGDIAFTTNSQSSNLLDWCQATFTQFQSQPMFQSTDFAWHRKPSVVMTTARKPLDVVGHSKAAFALAIAVQPSVGICYGGAALRYGEATLRCGEAAHRRRWPHTVSPPSATCTKTAFVA